MKKLSLLICLTLVSGFAFSQWIQLNPELTNPKLQLNSVFFTDVNTGYAVGHYEEDYRTKGFIIKTIDGGANWDTIWRDKTLENYSTLTSVFFTDENNGYVAGSYLGNGFILKTIDGGANWNKLTSRVCNSLYFTDDSTGYSVESISYISNGVVNYSGIISKTIDGGLTWDPLKLEVIDLNSVFFTDINTGYAVGSKSYHNSKGGISYDGIILKTIDGGLTWDPVCLAGGNFSSIHFPDANTGYVIDYSGMFKTADGGATWTNLLLYDYSINTYYYLNSLYFTNANTGYAVGRSGTIIKTIDGGITWTKLSSRTTNDLFSIFFPDANTGYAVGGRGTILKTTNGGGFPTAVENVPNESQFTIYPNPFNTVTTISWQLAKTSKVTLKVLDIVGRTVATLVDEQRPQGKYETQFNAGTLPKGIYFCQLKAGEFMQTRKMILLE
jgi:photosystem II stability/assembly factor-like uncharacterized protein